MQLQHLQPTTALSTMDGTVGMLTVAVVVDGGGMDMNTMNTTIHNYWIKL